MNNRCLLSGVVLAQNNEHTIGPVLGQLSTICDEIVVVDGGSSDRTLSIAHSFPSCRVYVNKFEGNFAAQRNFALDCANGEWTLTLDTDELLGIRALRYIPRLIRIPGVNWYSVPRLWLAEIEGEIKYLAEKPYYRGRQYRLLRNKPGLRYISSASGVHERLDKSDMGFGIALRGMHIFHYDFLLKSRQEREAKVARYLALDPGQHSVHEIYLWEDRQIACGDLPEPLPGDLRDSESVRTLLMEQGFSPPDWQSPPEAKNLYRELGLK